MRRALVFAGFLATFCLVLAPTANAVTTGTQTQVCPLPVIGGDPDTVTLTAPTTGTTWTVTADESPGEPSHIVTITVQISASDGSGPPLRVQTAIGMSPTSTRFDLAPGHHYTVQWLATFDYGPHICTPLLTGQAPFQIDT